MNVWKVILDTKRTVNALLIASSFLLSYLTLSTVYTDIKVLHTGDDPTSLSVWIIQPIPIHYCTLPQSRLGET